MSGRDVDPHDETLASTAGERAVGARDYQPGDRIGRYEIRRRLGEGGMAVVYEARDPQLGRNVAVKLLHSSLSQHMDRLVREAQAMAQLQHPNVVTVFEVGSDHEQIYICLELVVGSNLREWLEAKARTQPEIVATFAAAGRGLEAAHAMRIVHRDFKPDNVLLDAGGRPRVTDFGIARDMSEPGVVGPIDHASTLTDLRTPIPLTKTGALMGTPNYMAPELFDGAIADARSDQYAFCVALYEALYGAPPFAASSLPMLIAKVNAGKCDAVDSSRKVPRWLRGLVARGMSRDPAARFPTMTALLAELERDRGVIVRRAAAGALGLAAVGLGAALWLRGDAPTGPTCADHARLDGVWDAGRRANVEQAFRRSALPYADAALAAALARLDSYTKAWSAMDVEVCEAAALHRDDQRGLGPLRTLCLARRRADLGRAVDVLEKADASTVARADDVIAALDSVAECANAQELLQVAPPPSDPASVTAIDKVDTLLSDAQLRLELGEFDETAALLATAEQTLGAVDYARVRAHLLELQGELARRRGMFAAAERDLLAAATTAERGRDDRRKVRAFTELAYTIGTDLQDAARAAPYVALAESGLERIGGDRELRAELASTKTTIAHHAGDFDDALVYSREELALREGLEGQGPELGVAHSNMAVSLLGLHRDAEAAEHFARARDLIVSTYGEMHPLFAEFLNDQANGFVQAGKLDEAETQFRRALAIMEMSYGKRHPMTAVAASNLAYVLFARGRVEEAAKMFEDTLAIEEETVGPDSLSVAETLVNLAATQSARGAPAKAEANLRRAIEIREQHLAADDPRIAEVRATLGAALLAAKRYDDARPVLESAVARLADSPHESAETGEAQFALAQTLWELKADRTRAHQLAEAARAKLTGADADAVATWLATHR